ncbi:MAG: hypothetical protein NZ693_07600 [Thermoflexales bacterium]|nr:hypothetical protein [Thermoflexales bacterium]
MLLSAQALTLIAVGLFSVTGLFVLLAVSADRRGRNAPYYSQRRAARRQAGQHVSRAFITLLAAIASLTAARFVQPTTTPLAQPVVASLSTAMTPALPRSALPTVPAASPEPSPAATQTALLPSATPSPTEAPTPIPTPTETPAVLLPLSVPDAVPQPAAETQTRRLTLRAISSALDGQGMPIENQTTFSPGVAAIYIVFDYRNAPPSATVRHTWFRDGSSVHFDSQPLPDAAVGTSYVMWSPEGGFATGLYEVRIALGNTLQFVANFEVR